MSRAIQAPLPSASTIASSSTVSVRRREASASAKASCSPASASSWAWLRSSLRMLAHLVGEDLALVGQPRVDLALLARVDLRLADVVDPLVDEPPERRDALVLDAVLGDGLRLGEDTFELLAGLLVGLEEACCRR